MMRRLALLVLTASIVALCAACVPATTPVALTVSQATAFASLGHSCGGIQLQTFATGFDVATGDPTGAVYAQTKCGGSGKGGGYQVTTYSAWIGVTWDLTGATVASTTLTTAPTVDPAFSATDGHGDRVYNQLTATNVQPSACSVGNTTSCAYRADLTVPVPSAPTGVKVVQSGDSLVVSWTNKTGAAVTSSTVTAVPSGGGTTLTADVSGSGSEANLPGVAPATTYSVTVTSTDVSGTGPASTAVLLTTGPATTTPGVPHPVTAAWDAGGTAIDVAWTEPTTGDSPISDYQVSLAQHDPNGPPTTIDAGVTTAFAVTGFDPTLDWSISVRAHNAAGWSGWSTAVVVPATD